MKTFRTGNTILVIIPALVILWGVTGCNRLDETTDKTDLGIAANPGFYSGAVTLRISNTATHALVFQEGAPGAQGALKLIQGASYNLNLTGANVPGGTQFTLALTNIDLVAGTTTHVTLQLGDNIFVPSAAGNYVMKLIPSLPSVAPRVYQASVSCANPNFTQNSLDPTGISVTTSANNLYNYSAAQVTAHANGTAPYLCAFDLTGTGIRDTAFGDCKIPLLNQYSNYVGQRNIGVIVKDACNTTFTVSNPVTLDFGVPAKPGNVFIYGMNSMATGSAVGDSRIDGVNYLATNVGGNDIVQPRYNSGNFTISAFMNYGMPSSVKFGVQIDISNITDTLNLSNLSGTVDASQAVMTGITFSTDQAGDQAAARNLSSNSCVLSNQGARVIKTQGSPCSAGTTGSGNSADVEVWGDYVCMGLNDSGGSVQIEGSFDGATHMGDSCVGSGGGGGQGGGGILPIAL